MEAWHHGLHHPVAEGKEAEFFWTSGVALVAVAILGFIGSNLILVVLCSSDFKKKVFYKLLMALALFDLFFILSYSTLLGYRAFSCGSPDDVIYKITYPILNMALTGSIYMTMAVSLERYLGICHPLNAFCGTWTLLTSLKFKAAYLC